MNTSIRPDVLLYFACFALVVFSPLLTLPFRRDRRWLHVITVVSLVCSLAALGLVFYIFDSMMGASASLLFCAVLLLLGAGISMVPYYRHHSRISLFLGTLFAVGVIGSRFIDLSPVKPYKRFYAKIQEGMNEAEVMAVLRHEFPNGGRFPIPVLRSDDPARLMFFLDPNQSAFNAEGVFVTMENGKVVSKQYSPD